MSVCANRPADPAGALQTCWEANRGPCVCGAQVAAELINDTDTPEETR